MIPFWCFVCLTFGPAVVGYVGLTVTATALVGAIPLQLHVDTRRNWTVETDRWHSPGLEALPAPRQDLTGQWPLPVSAMDLPARWDTKALASVELVTSRARHACDVVAATPVSYVGRHLASIAVGEITQEFRRIMATEFGSHRCDSCTVGYDWEPQHVSCVGCSCPCSTVEPLPEGVDGYAITGRTRHVR